MKKARQLVQAVLASSLFMAGVCYADTTLSAQYDEPVPNPQLETKSAGNIEITTSGKVNATNIDGILMNSPTTIILIDSGNTTAGNNAIVASGVGNGIKIVNDAGKNIDTQILVGAGSNIRTTGTGHAIVIDDATATIVNQGGIIGGASAIHIPAGGVGANITNTGTTGLIIGGTAAVAPTINLLGNVANGAINLTLTNSSGAVIAATDANDAIQLSQNFTLVNNGSGSFINAVNGNAINIGPTAVGPITGDIENYGTVQTTGTGAALLFTGAYTGIINNNSGGILQSTGGGDAVVINNSFTTFNNAGQIIGAGGAGADGITIFGISPGTVNNTSTITAVNRAYYLNGTSTGLVNSGTMTSGTNTVWVDANGVLTNGIINTGTITNTGANNAIMLQNATTAPLFQNGGTISGNVLLAGNGTSTANNTVLTVTDGTIIGNVTSSAAIASTLQLNAGTITGTTTIGNTAAGTNIINLAGTTLQALLGGTGNDTFNLSGGSFTSLTGGGGGDIINVTGSFTQTGPISAIPTINVLNKGTFTVNNQINGTSAFNISAGGLMFSNFANLNGSLAATINIAATGGLVVNPGSTFTASAANNSGTLSILPGGKLVLSGLYDEFPTGIYAPVIASTTNFGILQPATTNFQAGSSIAPSLATGGVFLAAGNTFDVVQSGAPIAPLPTLVQPQSALVFFSQAAVGNNLRLTLGLNPIAAVAQGDNAQAIGAAIDPLLFGGTTNPELLAVLGQLQLAPDSTTLTQQLLQLAPSLNNALPSSSRISMDSALDSVQIHLEQLRGLGPVTQEEEYREIRNYELYNGVAYGDRNVIGLGINRFRTWAQVTGTILDQHKLNEVEGFKADAVGVSVGGDWRITNESVVGGAFSFMKVETNDNTTAENKVETWSYQATVYGWFQPWESIYFDAMLAVATHKYDTLRNMQIGNYTANATATFLGTQYGVQTDIGYAFLNDDNWYVAPYVRGRYTYLDIGRYSEKGAGGINLAVDNDPIDEMIAGIGLRIAAKRDYVQAIYVPEISATLLYDFAGTAQSMQSNFLGGGGFFYITGLSPQQLIQLYSLGVTAYTNDGYSAQLKFNFEHREQLFGYNAFLQISYQWD